MKGCWPAYYKPKEPLEPGTAALDPNHTHFILVDDGTRHKPKYGDKNDLRSMFEAHFSGMTTVGGK